jgi:hypothetical protein
VRAQLVAERSEEDAAAEVLKAASGEGDAPAVTETSTGAGDVGWQELQAGRSMHSFLCEDSGAEQGAG